jgi:hypothetical protein
VHGFWVLAFQSLGARKKLIVKLATKTSAAFKGTVSRDEYFLRGSKTSANDLMSTDNFDNIWLPFCGDN